MWLCVSCHVTCGMSKLLLIKKYKMTWHVSAWNIYILISIQTPWVPLFFIFANFLFFFRIRLPQPSNRIHPHMYAYWTYVVRGCLLCVVFSLSLLLVKWLCCVLFCSRQICVIIYNVRNFEDVDNKGVEAERERERTAYKMNQVVDNTAKRDHNWP